jgi:LysM repeat protein
MPEPEKLAKAEIREIDLDPRHPTQGQKKKLQVQFNPETLTVTYSNQVSGGDQRGGAAMQFAGQGTSKLTLDLWFDVTVPQANGQVHPSGDVRKLTEDIAYFIKPVERRANKWIPPGVQFVWGTFLFEGVMESLTEKLEYFSVDGKPLRAMVSVGLTSQMIQHKFNPDAAASGNAAASNGGTPGTQPQAQARSGDTVQSIAQANGQSNWKDVAAANGIENPRQLSPGQVINVNARP